MAKKYAITTQAPPWGNSQRTQKEQTYWAIKAAGEDGIDRESICKNTGLQKERVWFFLSELRRGGHIKRLGEAVDPQTLTPDEAKLHALTAMENALVITASTKGITPEMRKGFEKYQKCKALALGSKIPGEAHTALRMATIELVKIIY